MNNTITKTENGFKVEPLEILQEIKKDYVDKFDGDPVINRICTVMINEFKLRSK
jgi:hypothetical protein